MRASYREAVWWIALNDSPGDFLGLPVAEQEEETAGLMTVALVADLWGKDALTVARAVTRRRREHFS